jgi:hypothetical protein
MSAETSSSGDDVPENEPQPVDGLRLRTLPAASEPAFPLENDYFEVVYTPLVGPTAVLLARAIARHHDAPADRRPSAPSSWRSRWASERAAPTRSGKKSHLVHAIDRLAHNHVLARFGDRVLGALGAIPPLSRGTLAKLPAPARDAHFMFVDVRGERG